MSLQPSMSHNKINKKRDIVIPMLKFLKNNGILPWLDELNYPLEIPHEYFIPPKDLSY